MFLGGIRCDGRVEGGVEGDFGFLFWVVGWCVINMGTVGRGRCCGRLGDLFGLSWVWGRC